MRARYSEKEISKFIFYDFECYQKDQIHIPNYVVAISVCNMCQSDEFHENSTCFSCGSRCILCDKFNQKEKEYEYLPCVGCGKRMMVFKGESTKVDFCKWLLLEQHTNFTVIAHNSKAYDSYFIYQHLLDSSITPDPIIFCGSKIMFMKIGRSLNMRIVDSLNFLPMSLAKFPKCFELSELKKGFFPHYFNLPENQNLILPQLPDIEFYDPDSMTSERREEFLKWYDENKINTFNFSKEIHEYCLSDVKILMEGCMKFRELVMSVTGEETLELNPEDMIFEKVLQNTVDPFSFLTIASVCMGIFRAKYLPEKWKILTTQEHLKHDKCYHEWNCQCQWLEGRKINASSPLEVLINGEWKRSDEISIKKSVFVSSPIGLIPSQGYNNSDNHSKQSLQWLSIVEKNFNENGHHIKIQHARTAHGEKFVYYNTGKNRIRYKLDGYFEINQKKYACEFYGCNWHGCPKCYIRDQDITVNHGKSLAQRYRETILKAERLKELGFELLTKWSCEFKIDLYQNCDLKDYVSKLKIVDPLNIRDAYYGGRTNALCLYKKFENGEQGNYVDFCSLYPDVLKYQKFPIGHPENIVYDFKPITYAHCNENPCQYKKCPGYHVQFPYFGIVKAKFLPPRNLIHPVLPVRCNGKLKFPLCFHCANEGNEKECKCNDEKRSFIHTYCTGEVELPLNMGYKIIEMYEVLHWKYFDQYDKIDEQGGIFTNYISAFLKIKQESSGVPEDVVNISNYIEEYRKHEGILMIEENIRKNPGLRGVSKLALNSFYGKFGQRTNMKKTKILKNVGSLFNLMTDKSKEISDFHIINENVMEIEFRNAVDFEPLSSKTNPVIAAFCTSWARIKLWFAMNDLGSRVLYHDTDSIIFSTAVNQIMPSLGNYLGDLTNELSCGSLGCKAINCSGHWITEFISCGPKNYAYKLNTDQIVCKVRGFSLNFSASQVINLNSMKDILDSWLNNDNESKIKTIKTEIRRNKHDYKVYSQQVEKHYGMVYDK